MRKQQPDIVHGYMMTAYVLAAIAGWTLGTRVIVGSRRGLVTYRRHTPRRWSLVARMANQVIDYHLCNSEALRELVIADEALPRAKTGVIYNGLAIPTEHPPEFPTEWNVSEGDGCAAMVANFIRYKGHTAVIEATRLVVRRWPRFKLVLFGEGPERSAIERLVRQEGLEQNVVLAGARLDAASHLSGFDFTVLGSSQESFPNALMESMARGVPVVATRVGGVPELVRAGIDGTLIEFGEPEQLAAAMLEMLENPQMRRRMGIAAHKRVREMCSVEKMVNQTQELYKDLLAKARPRITATTP